MTDDETRRRMQDAQDGPKDEPTLEACEACKNCPLCRGKHMVSPGANARWRLHRDAE